MSTITKMQTLLKNATVNEFPTKLTRNSGGSTRNNSPFLSGGLLFYLIPPSAITTNTTSASTDTTLSDNSNSVSNIFHCSAENFTPHTRAITTNTVPGLFGVKASFPTTQDISTTFSITMREWTNMPIIKSVQLWQNLIFDPNHGLSLTKSHLSSEFKGDAIVFYIKPNINDGTLTENMVEQMFWYTGVFPTTADIPASDISAPDFQTIPVTFSFDGHPFTMENKGMLTKAVGLITTLTSGIAAATTENWFSLSPQSSNTTDKAFG